jgi:hypothetical protein
MGLDTYVKKDKEYIYFERIGSGTNFYEMRLAIKYSLENGEQGSRFPILQRTPDSEATFSMEQAIALKAEVETIIREQDNLKEEYKDVPYHAFPGEPPTRDFSFPRDSIIERLEVILKGCELAIISGGELGWVY